MKMLKNKKMISIAALLAMMVVVLGGCGPKFDAAGYTQAVLDTEYKNETEKYMEITDSTADEAQAVYDSTLTNAMDAFVESSELVLDDEMYKKYQEFFAQLFASVKYTVGEAEEDEDGNFTVDVTVEPIQFDEGLSDALDAKADEYIAQKQEEINNGAAMPTDAEMDADIARFVYEIYHEYLGTITYGDPQVITISVTKDEDGLYQISEDDLIAIDNVTLSAIE